MPPATSCSRSGAASSTRAPTWATSHTCAPSRRTSRRIRTGSVAKARVRSSRSGGAQRAAPTPRAWRRASRTAAARGRACGRRPATPSCPATPATVAGGRPSRSGRPALPRHVSAQCSDAFRRPSDARPPPAVARLRLYHGMAVVVLERARRTRTAGGSRHGDRLLNRCRHTWRCGGRRGCRPPAEADRRRDDGRGGRRPSITKIRERSSCILTSYAGDGSGGARAGTPRRRIRRCDAFGEGIQLAVDAVRRCHARRCATASAARRRRH